MAAITVTTLPGTVDYDGSGDVTANAFSLTTAVDTIASTGLVFIRLENTGTTARTVTIDAEPDALDRERDCTISIGGVLGEVHYAGPFSREGWVDSSGNINITASGAGIDVEAVQFPVNHRA
jgi:hypothetical protein